MTTWPQRRLADLLAEPLTNGRSVPTRSGGFPVLRLTALRDGKVDLTERKEGAWDRLDARAYLVRHRDFLVARGNGSLDLVGRGALVDLKPDEVAYPDTMIRIRVDEAVVHPRYLRLVWNSPIVRSQIESAARTTAGIYKINQRHLQTVELPVPSLDEQHCIVEIMEDHLSRLEAAEAYLGNAGARLRALSELTVVDAITGAGVDRPNVAATISAVGTYDGYLPSLPPGWSWSRLGEVADVVGGVTKDAKKQSEPSYVEVPYLRVANVQRGHFDLGTVARIRVSPAKAESLRLQPGDVLLNEGGDRDKLARGWVWEGQVDGCIHQNHVFRARIREPRVDPYFLSWTANTFGGRWAERNGKQSVNLASISLSTIRRMPVIVPPPGVATRVAAYIRDQLASFDRMQTTLTNAARATLALRHSLLGVAFSGCLTGSESDQPLAESLVHA